jgi:TolB-like protein
MSGAAQRRSTVLKTLLVSDLSRSTQLVTEMGDRRSADLFARHEREARRLLVDHGGREIDKTDGFLIVFDRPSDAVQYAVAYHRALVGLSRTVGVPLEARVGIHLGEVILRENTPDEISRGAKPVELDGLAKPIAARLMSLARPGQTLITRGAYDLARRGVLGTTQPREELRWVSHGEYLLAGVSEPLEVCEVAPADRAALGAPGDTEKARRSGAARGHVVLVLPFDNLMGRPDQEHVSLGLADEVITHLSKVHAVSVISRTAAVKLKSSGKDVREVARELGVQHFLEGSVRGAAGALRIHAQLVNARTDEIAWAEVYSGPLDDLLDVQETIARAVVDALKVTLSAEESARIAERPIPNMAAYELWLRARQETLHFSKDALDRALRHLEAGEALIGDNVLLLAAKGYVYWQYVNAGASSDRAYLDRARDCAERIMRLEADSPHGHRLLGLVGLHGEGRNEEVLYHLRKALAQDPGDTDALFWLALICGFAGRPVAGRPLVERLLRVDPLTPFYQILPGFLSLMDCRPADALGPFETSLAMDPTNPIVRTTYGQILAMVGRRADADAAFERVVADAPDSFFASLARLFQHGLAGRRDEVLATLTPEVAATAREDLQYSWSVAECLSLVGEKDAAVGWLGNAVRQGLWNYPLLAGNDPFLGPLAGHPAFEELLHDVRRRWESFHA